MKRKKQKTFTDSQVGTLLEHVDGKIDLVVEGHKALDKKIDDFRSDVDERFHGVDYKFDVVFEKLDSVESELHVIRNELKEKISRDEFQLLEKRVATLEKRASQKV